MKNSEGIVRKQSLIDKAKKSVFVWVVLASAVVGAAIVVSILLVQMLLFNEKVLGEKNKTNTTLKASIDNAKELRGSVRELSANPELSRVRASEKAEPLQSVLDALPADPNALAMGASLQQRLLNDIPGLSVDMITIASDDMIGDEAIEESGATSEGVMGQMFTLTLSGSPEAIQTALQRFERSIRAVDVDTLKASSANEKLTVQLTGQMSYLAPMEITKTEKTIKE